MHGGLHKSGLFLSFLACFPTCASALCNSYACLLIFFDFLKIYCFGGGDGVQALNDIHILDPGEHSNTYYSWVRARVGARVGG